MIAYNKMPIVFTKFTIPMIVVAICLISFSFDVFAAEYEGFGAVTRGADDCPKPFTIHHVTNRNDSGEGSLREEANGSCRKVVFDVGGTIRLSSELNLNDSYVTIDGSTAPAPGITIDARGQRLALEAGRSSGPIHDVIISNIRIQGDGGDGETLDILELDGMTNPVTRIILDHITAIAASDGVFDMYGEVSDVSVSNSLIIDTIKAIHLSYAPKERKRISFHHNVWARNNERQIRLRHHNELIDFVNNVIYGWGWMNAGAAGLSIDTNSGVSNNEFPKLNMISNVYHYVPGLHGDQDDAIVRQIKGQIYFADNIFPAEEKDDYSTSAQHMIPSEAQVTTYPASTLGDTVVPCVGTHHRTVEEQTLLNKISTDIGGSGKGCSDPPNSSAPKAPQGLRILPF